MKTDMPLNLGNKNQNTPTKHELKQMQKYGEKYLQNQVVDAVSPHFAELDVHENILNIILSYLVGKERSNVLLVSKKWCIKIKTVYVNNELEFRRNLKVGIAQQKQKKKSFFCTTFTNYF